MLSVPAISGDLHPTLTEYVVKLLQKHRLTNVYDLVKCDSDKLMKITNLSFDEVAALRGGLTERFAGNRLLGVDYLRLVESRLATVPTGIAGFDAILQGGLLPGHILELCGEPAAGKTQLCLTIAAAVAYQQQADVLYVDTKCDFSATRVQQILETRYPGANERAVGNALARIKVERVFAPDKLIQLLDDIRRSEEVLAKAKVLVIDSLPALWYLLQDSKSSCQPVGMLTSLAAALRRLAAENVLSVVIVNLRIQHAAESFTSSAKSRRRNSSELYPALGKFWESAPGTRLLLQRLPTGNSTATVSVWKSSYLRFNDRAMLHIADCGVR